MGTYKANPTSRKKIRDLANTVRRIIKLEKIKKFPIIVFIESFLTELGYNWEICEEKDMGKDYAITYPEEKLLKIREDVYIECASGNPRHRFTLAHELRTYNIA